jgi:hypothetical protein
MKGKLAKLALHIVHAKAKISAKADLVECLKVEFPVGCAVRVIDEGLGKVYFGSGWIVQGHLKDGSLRLEGQGGKKAQAHRNQVMKTAGLVKAGALKLWQKVTNAERDDWLLQAGFDGSSDEAEWNAFRDEVHKEVPFRLWNAHITLFSRHLLWGVGGARQCGPDRKPHPRPGVVRGYRRRRF